MKKTRYGRIRKVTGSLIYSTLLFVGICEAGHAQSILPTSNDGAVAPDDWLIGKGRAWFFHGLQV